MHKQWRIITDMKGLWRALVIIIVFFPAVSFAAQVIEAGFPAQAIWVSKTNAVAGDSVEIYTVVYNGGGTSIRGTVIFTADGSKIGAKQFVLDAGKTEIEFVTWTALAGNHKLGASIEDVTDPKTSEAVILSNKSAGELEITVANPPPPSALEQGVNIITTVAKEVASASAPIISGIAKSVYQATESFRNDGIAFAEKYLATSSPQESGTTKAPDGSGKNTTVASSESPTVTGEETDDSQQKDGLISRLSQLAASAILFTFGSRYIFYPLLCLLALGVLYLLGRMVNRPR